MDEALRHPEITAVLGGEKHTQRYLHEFVHAGLREKFTNWFQNDTKSYNDESLPLPLARFLVLERIQRSDHKNDIFDNKYRIASGKGQFLGVTNVRPTTEDGGKWYKIRIKRNRPSGIDDDGNTNYVWSGGVIIVKADDSQKVRLYRRALQDYSDPYNHRNLYVGEIEAVDGPIDPSKSVSLVGKDLKRALAAIGVDKTSMEKNMAELRRELAEATRRTQKEISKLEAFLKEV